MLRILHIVSCMERGGTEAYILNNMRILQKEDIIFDFVISNSIDPSIKKEILESGGKIFHIGAPSFLKIPSYICKLISIICKNRSYKTIHCHMNISNAWPLFASMCAGVTTRISHSHSCLGKRTSFFGKIYTYIEEKIIRFCATHFLSCSTEAGQYLYGQTFFTQKGQVMKNGIDVNKLIKSSENESSYLLTEWNIPANCDLIVGNITRFDDNKNTLFTIHVFKEILNKKPNAILILGGNDGGLLEKSKNLVKQLSIDDSVRFIGVRADVPECLAFIDTYIFPSKTEGLGIAILEAQAAGCHCFVSDSVPNDVDLGIGLVTFLSIKDTPKMWSKCILNNFHKNTVSTLEIQNAFLSRSFNITQSSKELSKIYTNVGNFSNNS